MTKQPPLDAAMRARAGLSWRLPRALGRGDSPACRCTATTCRSSCGSSSPIASRPARRAVAEQNVLVLDTSMMDIYEGALAQYKRNMRERVPIILALFSEGGGQMILYRPGHEPLVAEPVPIVYQLAKSVSHSSMAVYQLVAPYLADPSDKSWHGPMKVFRTRCQTALR